MRLRKHRTLNKFKGWLLNLDPEVVMLTLTWILTFMLLEKQLKKFLHLLWQDSYFKLTRPLVLAAMTYEPITGPLIKNEGFSKKLRIFTKLKLWTTPSETSGFKQVSSRSVTMIWDPCLKRTKSQTMYGGSNARKELPTNTGQGPYETLWSKQTQTP